jgi:phenylacetate-CoA ligase
MSWPYRLMHELIERAMGRPTAALERRLRRGARSARPAPTEDVAFIRDHAAAHTRFYAQRAKAPPRGDDASVPPGPRAWPLLSRDDVARHADAMCWQGTPHRRLYCASGGTTDEGVAVYWDRLRQAWDRANRRRALSAYGFHPGDRELHIWPVDPPAGVGARLRGMLRHARDRMINECLIDAATACGDDARGALDRWLAFNPVAITAYPSVLCDLIRVGIREGVALRPSSLRHVFVTGEVLFEAQRQFIERMLGVPVTNLYGLQEVGAVAYEYPRGVWRVNTESVHLEYIRDERPARAGALAEVVATALHSRTMPVIRYCTGDIVRLPASPADAPTTMPPILGRTGDFIVGRQGNWTAPADVLDALSPWLDVGTYVLRQWRLHRFTCQTTRMIPSQARRAMASKLSALTDSDAEIEFETVGRLARSDAYKLRPVVSLLSRAGLAQPHRMVRAAVGAAIDPVAPDVPWIPVPA